jgi:hypothetical protein
MEVMNKGTASSVEEIRADPAIASTPTLLVSDVGEGIFDVDPLAQVRPPRRRRLTFAQFAE